MELFDFLKSLFGSSKKYEEASILDKRNHFFMAQRRMSIGHPYQASILNHVRINKEQALDIWWRFLSKYKSPPHWLFISGVKKAEEKKSQKINISKAEMEDFASKMGYDLKSVKQLSEFFPNELKKEISKLNLE